MMIPPELFPQCDQLVRKGADGVACEGFMAGLPEPGQGLLRLLLALLQQIDADATRMTADNLSRVFALTVIKREDPLEMANHVASDAAFVSHLIQRLPLPDAEQLDSESEDGTRSSSPSPLSRMESTPAKIAREEAERLAELDKMLDDPELKDAGMNKGGKRQTLVAERLRLVRNAEDRKKKEKLHRLLAEGVINVALQKMRRPLASPGELTAEFDQHRADLELLLATELGRENLANVLEQVLSPARVQSGKDAVASADPPGVASFPAEGFDCLCAALDMALNEMSDASAPIFDIFVACQWSGRASIVHHIDFPRQDTAGNPPGGVEHFCFPVDPSTIAKLPPKYTIVRTLDDGTRQYGFCKAVEVEDGDGGTTTEVLCLLSRRPWFSLFERVMIPLAEARLTGGYNAAGRLLDSLFKHAKQTFPMPGERFCVSRRKADDLFLTRPNDESFPLADADCCDLFKCLGVPGVMAIFKAMMVEGHCVFVSSDFHKLGVCAQAAASLLYPFAWQHIFVPILPRSWIDYVTAPMPFICGVHDSMLDEVLQQPIEDAMVFMKLDTGEIMTVGDEQGTLPQGPGAKLEKTLSKLLADLNKSRMLSDVFNSAVRDAFMVFMLDVFGGYRPHIATASPLSKSTDFELDVEKFTESFEDQSTRSFVQGVQGSQMFDIWCRERCELKRNAYPRVGLFETRVAEMEAAIAGASTGFQLKAQPNRDVTTARRLVHVSEHLTNQNALLVGQGFASNSTVLQRIRTHDLWKNKSLWDDMFEDGLDDALLVKLHVVTDTSTVTRTRSHSAAGPSDSPSFAAKGGGARRRASIVVHSQLGMNQVQMPPDLSSIEKEFCDKVVGFAERMLMFGLPLDLVMKFAESSTQRHKITYVGTVKDTILIDISPRHAHIQKVMKEGWLDVEGENKKKWGRRWFAIRGTSLCLYDKHDSKEPDAAFPCGACEVLEPKNQRKGHSAVFRINVAAYAVGSSTATSGTKSHTSALKFIVDAESTADRHSWYRAFDNAGASIPPTSKAIIEEEQRKAEETQDEEDSRPVRRPGGLAADRSPQRRLGAAGGSMVSSQDSAVSALEEDDSEEESDADSDDEDGHSPVAQQEELAKMRADLAAAKQALSVSNSKEADATTELKRKIAETATLREKLERMGATSDDGTDDASGDADKMVASLQADVKRVGSEHDRATALLAEKTAAYEALAIEHEKLKIAHPDTQPRQPTSSAAELESLKSELMAATALAGDASEKSLALAAQVTRLSKELAESKQAVAEGAARMSTLDGELVAKTSAHDTALAELSSLRTAHEQQTAQQEQKGAPQQTLLSHHTAHQGSNASLLEERESLRAQLETTTKALDDERTTYSSQLHDLRAQIQAMHAAHADTKAKHEQELAQLKLAHNRSLETELSSLRRTHTLELESMRESMSEAMATDAASAIEREQLRRAAEREASRHRLARTLEAELKAIAGAMDDGEIQSMWDSHPTLDSIRRRRRGMVSMHCRAVLCAIVTRLP